MTSQPRCLRPKTSMSLTFLLEQTNDFLGWPVNLSPSAWY